MPRDTTNPLPSLTDVAFDPSGLADESDSVLDAQPFESSGPPSRTPLFDDTTPPATTSIDTDSARGDAGLGETMREAPGLQDAAGSARSRLSGARDRLRDGLALEHVQEARDVRFERATTTGRYLPDDPAPAPESDGVDRHPDHGTYVSNDATDAGIERGRDGRFRRARRRGGDR